MGEFPPAVVRKITREKRNRQADGFPPMGQHHYLEWLQDLHGSLMPDVYFEIGTETGASLAFAQGAAIAVDPEFKVGEGVIKRQSEVHFFQQTSDAFFEGDFLKRFGRKIDLAFLDGMHKFEYLLRDFMNTEPHMAPEGTILLHDCVPMSFPAAEREWDKTKTRRWTGDVWKVVPILKEYRPDLEIRVFDLAPSGVVEIRGFGAVSRALQDHYDEIVAEYAELSLETFGIETLVDVLAMERANAKPPAVPKPADRWERPATPAARTLNIAIKTPKARQKHADKIVDFPFARAVADGLLACGHSVRIDPGSEWYSNTEGTDFDLVLRGRGGFKPQNGIPQIIWAIYPGKKERHQITDEEVRSAAHCFFASEGQLYAFQNSGHENVSCLMQGFDPRIMRVPEKARRGGTLFVGSNHFKAGELRPIVDLALRANHPLKIWGRGWGDPRVSDALQARTIENARLGALYGSAEIVLCDHMESMRLGGYISNRIYDALACGAAVITDDVSGLPEAFSKDVFPVKTPEEFAAAVAAIEAESYVEKQARLDRAKDLQSRHSLFHRAQVLSDVMSQHSDR